MRKIARCTLVMLSMFLLTSCAQTYFTGFKTESNFAYPNSNVVPVGLAKGDSGLKCGFTPPFVNSSMQSAAVTNALQQRSGDILINYLEFVTYYQLPIVSCIKYSVEGTAAKMTIGSQKLH